MLWQKELDAHIGSS